MSNRIIAVAGATGQQGGIVARRLLADGWQVRALTRDANKPAAQELKALGAEIVPGDMDNRVELEAAFQGVYGVFSVQNFWLPNVGFEGEIRQGKNVADVALLYQVELIRRGNTVVRQDWQPATSKEKDAKGTSIAGKIDLAGLPSGIYELRVTVKEPQSTRVIQRTATFGIE